MPEPYCVVIPAFNAARTLAEAIASIRAQTAPAREIVVVDDGSTDATCDVARGCGEGVRVIRQENAGPGAATTRGIAAVATPLVAFLDADDLWLPDKMARQLERLDADAELAGIYGRVRQFRDGREDDGTGLVQANPGRTTLVIRTAVARRIGAIIDPPGLRGDMVDWISRLREDGHGLAAMDDVLALRRIHPGSLSYGRTEARDLGYVHAAKRALDRRRAAARRSGDG